MPISTTNFYAPTCLAALLSAVQEAMISLRCIVTGENILKFNFFISHHQTVLNRTPLMADYINECIKETEAAPRTTAGYKLCEGIGVALLSLFLILPSIALDTIILARMASNGIIGLFSPKASNNTMPGTENDESLYNGLEEEEEYTPEEKPGPAITPARDNAKQQKSSIQSKKATNNPIHLGREEASSSPRNSCW